MKSIKKGGDLMDFYGRLIFINYKDNRAMWEDRNGKTHLLSLPELAEFLALRSQILQANKLAKALA